MKYLAVFYYRPVKVLQKVTVALLANPNPGNGFIVCILWMCRIFIENVPTKFTLRKILKTNCPGKLSVLQLFIQQVSFLAHNSPILTPGSLKLLLVWQPPFFFTFLCFFHHVFTPTFSALLFHTYAYSLHVCALPFYVVYMLLALALHFHQGILANRLYHFL